MMSWDQFATLRLTDFYTPEDEVLDLHGWEYMDEIWVGEAVGFTEWLRLDSDPEVLRALSLHLTELPHEVSEAVLQRVGLPLAQGITLEQVNTHLGQPHNTLVFTKGQATHQYQHEAYNIHCTIRDADGLQHITILRQDYSHTRRPPEPN